MPAVGRLVEILLIMILKMLEEIAAEKLPPNIGIEWSGLSYQEKKQSGQTGIVILLAFLFVFLFLAAQYESWSVPIAVLLSLPAACIGAFIGIGVFGLENNVYFQIGIVMLIGMAAKNAILIVEFAKEQVDKGVDIVDAAVIAGTLRFRPIVMTSIASVAGMLPMALGTGLGSELRASCGMGVVGGLIFASLLTLYVIPAMYFTFVKDKVSTKE